jgi:hypothetical protein
MRSRRRSQHGGNLRLAFPTSKEITMGNKQAKTTQPVESNLPAVVKRIHDKCPEVSAAILSLLHLSRRPIARVNDGVMFGEGTPAQHLVRMDGKSADWVMKELVDKFHVGDAAAVQAFLRHRWSSFKPRADRQALGQYFSPQHVVAAISPMVDQLVSERPDAVVLDPAAGGGALVSRIQSHRVVVADRDPNAAALLRRGVAHQQPVECQSIKVRRCRERALGRVDEPTVQGGQPLTA